MDTEQRDRVRRSAERWRDPADTACSQCGARTEVTVREDGGTLVVSTTCPSCPSA